MKKIIASREWLASLAQLKRAMVDERLTGMIYTRMLKVKRNMLLSWLDGVLFVLDRAHIDTKGSRALETIYHRMLMTSVDEVMDELATIEFDDEPAVY